MGATLLARAGRRSTDWVQRIGFNGLSSTDSNLAESMVSNRNLENNTIYENYPENFATLKAYVKRDQYDEPNLRIDTFSNGLRNALNSCPQSDWAG